jgi:hypothetical protein
MNRRNSASSSTLRDPFCFESLVEFPKPLRCALPFRGWSRGFEHVWYRMEACPKSDWKTSMRKDAWL